MSSSVDRSSRATLSTVLSVGSFESSEHTLGSTALTSPSLGGSHSPRKFQPMEDIDEVFESSDRDRPLPAMPVEADMASASTSTLGPETVEVVRGPSVRDRASRYEQAFSPGPTLAPLGRTRSTSPLRPRRGPVSVAAPNTTTTTQTAGSTPRRTPNHTPTQIRRVPVPATEPTRRTVALDDTVDGTEGSPLGRGSGSARRMIAQWEENSVGVGNARSLVPTTPVAMARRGAPLYASANSTPISLEYLDRKPLPIPRANTIPATVSIPTSLVPPLGTSTPPNRSPGRNFILASPRSHLQTPTSKRSGSLTPSPSSFSLSGASPSSDKKRKLPGSGRSPLKDILGAVGGGIKDLGRRAKGKGRERDREKDRERAGFSSVAPGRKFMSLDEGNDDPWRQSQPVGTNGLPGGIVFSDRMGDQEMGMDDRREGDPMAIRSSPVMYLIPTPCSSVSPWGSWLTSWATLTAHTLSVTYVPLFHAGHSSPRRVLSGMSNAGNATPYSAIPAPPPGSTPDVELSMKDCVEVRSLRRDEVRGRGVPSVPEGAGTEVLEIVFTDGSKRYIGVEGVGGRLGWVSAIWDVLLACKSTQPLELPPLSPAVSVRKTSAPIRAISHPISSSNNGPSTREPIHSPPQVHKIGDTWVGAGLDEATPPRPTTPPNPNPDAVLRDSLQRMFDSHDRGDMTLDDVAAVPVSVPVQDDRTPRNGGLPSKSSAVHTPSRSAAMEARIRAWQPQPVDARLGFPASPRRRAEDQMDIDIIDDYIVAPKSESHLSFDPNDLNPSRSASQVRRTSTVAAAPPTEIDMDSKNDDLGELRRPPGHSRRLPALAEGSEITGPVSHVTFPKPMMGGRRLAAAAAAEPLPPVSRFTPRPVRPLPVPVMPGALGNTDAMMSESEPRSGSSSSDTHTIRESIMPTPRTDATSMTSLSSDPTVLAKLDEHTSEHNTISRQLDNVQVDLTRVATSIGTLTAMPAVPVTVPKALEDKIDSLGLNLRAVESAVQLSSLAAARVGPPEEPKLLDIHTKLDEIAKLCQELMAKQVTSSSTISAGGAAVGDEEKKAGEEVALIMADATGSQSKSPRLADLQVLHNEPASTAVSSSPVDANAPIADTTASTTPSTQELGEILALVKEIQGARSLQTQQTTDIARYLGDLNGWLEKFVQNSGTELSTMSKRVAGLVDTPSDGPATGLVADIHAMVSAQAKRAETEGMQGHRLDALLSMMGEERERQAAQMTVVERVTAMIDRQRQENEMLLRAVATDLTTEIRGERVRFIEAMRQATTMNIQAHIDEFKKLLSAEVNRSIGELGQLREQKKALEHQISDLFALKAKHGTNSGENSRQVSVAPPAHPHPMASPNARNLPMLPHGR